jgi:hypothetical protein
MSLEFTGRHTGPTALEIAVALDRNCEHTINSVMEAANRVVKEPLRRGARQPGDMRPHLLDTITLKRASIKILSASVSTNSPIAIFRENNVRPHVIVPRNAQVLRFIPRGGGAPIFAKYVSHPGSAGTHSWRKAGEFVEENFQPLMKVAIDAALQGHTYDAMTGGIMAGLLAALGHSENP